MRRILVISPGVLPLPPVLGGAVENLITRLHPALAREFEMEYVSVRPPKSCLQSNTAFADARFHYIDSINPLEDFTLDNQFDLHESSKWPAYIEFCVQTARARKPWIIHVHNEAHLISHLRRVLPDTILILHINDEVVTRCNPARLLALGESCDLILACSRFIAQAVEEAFAAAAVDPPRLEVFYNFVDVREYDPSSIDAARIAALRTKFQIDGEPVLLFVGRMVEEKGPHLALRALRKIIPSIPKVQLLCVGAPWYSRNNESPFLKFVREEFGDLKSHVRFTGYVDHADMPLYYALADIVCAPSIWDDPSPFVVYEGQAMARPVVTSKRGGIPEIVRDHVTGRCIDVFNIGLFADVVRQLSEDRSLARQLGQRGREHVSCQFELRNAQQCMLAIYRRFQ